ncbi:MAG: hypothetical protein KM296_09550, partial [Brockia lithotrophica]|nr:hypothetical protein [Brockia lithotrophica]
TAEETLAFLRRYHRKRRTTRTASGVGGASPDGQSRAGPSDSEGRSRGMRDRGGRGRSPVRIPAYIRLEDVLGEDPSPPEAVAIERFPEET